MAYVVFANAAVFNTYHQAVCTANGIPRPGYLASDNATVEINNQWTTSWVQPFFNGPSALSPIVCLVPDTDVATYNLTLTTPVTVASPFGPVPQSTTYPSTALAKPTQWTDPHTGIVYNVGP